MTNDKDKIPKIMTTGRRINSEILLAKFNLPMRWDEMNVITLDKFYDG